MVPLLQYLYLSPNCYAELAMTGETFGLGILFIRHAPQVRLALGPVYFVFGLR